MAENNIDHSKTCFVVMPYSVKTVSKKKVDFDQIYDKIFDPAIRGVRITDDESFRPLRQDRSYLPGVIHKRMLIHILLSELVLADITAHNPNAILELGGRIMTDRIGTTIVRQPETALFFDVQIFPIITYEYTPEDKAEHSRQTITGALSQGSGVLAHG